jgi:hypothetical protein
MKHSGLSASSTRPSACRSPGSSLWAARWVCRRMREGPVGSCQPSTVCPAMAAGLYLGAQPDLKARLGTDFSLPTCPHVLNVFHPFDPLAYRCVFFFGEGGRAWDLPRRLRLRPGLPQSPLTCLPTRLEVLLDPGLEGVSPVQVDHAGGRTGKRIHRGENFAGMLRWGRRINESRLAEVESYLRGAGRDLRNEVTSWAGSALSSFSQVLKQRTGRGEGGARAHAGRSWAAVRSRARPGRLGGLWRRPQSCCRRSEAPVQLPLPEW